MSEVEVYKQDCIRLSDQVDELKQRIAKAREILEPLIDPVVPIKDTIQRALAALEGK